MSRLAEQMLVRIVNLYDLGEMILAACRSALEVPRHGWRPVLAVYLRQVYFSGLEALRIVLVTALIIGTVVVTQIVSIAGGGAQSITGKVLVWVVVRELAPLLTGIIVAARSGTAIATELSQMKIAGELDYLESLGIPVANYLILPRLLGVASAVVALTVYFGGAAVLGGFLVLTLGWQVPWEQYAQGLFSALTISELAASVGKSALFGLCIAAACCRQGLSVGRSVTQIPQAATRAVMQSLFLLFAIDGVVALCFLF